MHNRLTGGEAGIGSVQPASYLVITFSGRPAEAGNLAKAQTMNGFVGIKKMTGAHYYLRHVE